MKDPSYTEAWVDALALRIRLNQEILCPSSKLPPISEFNLDATTAAVVAMPANCKVTRSSAESQSALRDLPSPATILLFTPVLPPAGTGKAPKDETNMDPFEVFGRALIQYHKRIRHVPYVPKVGFTETHDAWISQADAVIVVVCEPDRFKHESMSNQMDFAEATLDAVEDKEANASSAMVLVQCGEDEFRPPVDASFMSVVECTTYDAEIAKHIARAIFKPGS